MSPLSDWLEFGEAATFEVLAEQPDPRGASYGKKWLPNGATFEGMPLKQGSAEKYAMGYDATKIVYKILCDPPLVIDEKKRVRSEATGELDLSSVVEYPSETIAILVGDRTA